MIKSQSNTLSTLFDKQIPIVPVPQQTSNNKVLGFSTASLVGRSERLELAQSPTKLYIISAALVFT